MVSLASEDATHLEMALALSESSPRKIYSAVGLKRLSVLYSFWVLSLRATQQTSPYLLSTPKEIVAAAFVAASLREKAVVKMTVA